MVICLSLMVQKSSTGIVACHMRKKMVNLTGIQERWLDEQTAEILPKFKCVNIGEKN
jgi:hypothetical protein